MKPGEAIEILKLDKKCEYEGPGVKLEDALQLGIEALEDVLKDRIGSFTILLPSETEE